MSPRYAIYYAPPEDSPLSEFASAWLGRCARTGATRPHPMTAGFQPETIHRLTAAPRRYGFHATLKAPFFLAAQTDEQELSLACSAFAETQRALILSLVLDEIGDFIALTPDAPHAELTRLAQDCVVHFDRFRRPPDAQELARRRAAGLTSRQDANLLRWGYPYVLDDFRFHMTLTGPVPDEMERRKLVFEINKHLNDMLRRPFAVNAIALFRQDAEDRPFLCISEHPFES